MPRKIAVPHRLGDVFSVSEARDAGVPSGRLRGSDLARPFHGVRSRGESGTAVLTDPFARNAADTARRAHAYAKRMRPEEFFVYETAVHLYDAPMPGWLAGEERPLDVGVLGNDPLPRCDGVRGRRLTSAMTSVVTHRGLRVTSPATTWAMLGHWRIVDLIALGDYFCRVWRDGVGRREVGRAPLTTRDQLSAALAAGRRRIGAPALRAALDLIREDSWSPRESACRVHLVTGGLPEPDLNIDIFDNAGGFLGCVDMAYPEFKVAIEYQGAQHSATYAHDVERIERLRANGWIVIQVTSELYADPWELVARVTRALRKRGWRR